MISGKNIERPHGQGSPRRSACEIEHNDAHPPVASLVCAGRRNHQTGASLVEMAFGLMVFGLCLAICVQAFKMQARGNANTQSLSRLHRAEQALIAYSQLHGRLPCAASDSGGIEDCSGTTASLLPYMTLGLAESQFGSYRYERDATAPLLDGADTYQVPTLAPGAGGNPLQPKTVLLSTVTSTAADPAYNFCWALTSSPAAASRMAYRITAPESRGDTEAVGKVNSAFMGRGQLGARMRCADLAVSGRAHFDLLVGARLMERGGSDNLKVFNEGIPTAYIDIAQGAFFAAAATHGVFHANNTADAAQAQYHASNPPDFSLQVTHGLARAKVPAIAAHALTLSTQVVRFGINLAKTLEYQERLSDLQDEISASVTAIQENAHRGTRPIFVRATEDQPQEAAAQETP